VSRRLLDLDLVLGDDVAHRHPREGEDAKRLLVELTHAKVRVVRRDARLAQALVIIRRAHGLAPRDVGVAKEVFAHEATADDRGEADRTPQRDDRRVVPDLRDSARATVDAPLGDLLPVRDGVLPTK